MCKKTLSVVFVFGSTYLYTSAGSIRLKVAGIGGLSIQKLRVNGEVCSLGGHCRVLGNKCGIILKAMLQHILPHGDEVWIAILPVHKIPHKALWMHLLLNIDPPFH